MRPPRFVLASVLCALVLGCGSKSGLRLTDGTGGGGATGGSGNGGSGGGGTGGSAGTGGSSGAGGSAGSGGSAGAPYVCGTLLAGPAVEVMSFPDRHATAPSAVRLGAMSPARVAIQAFAGGGSSALHPDIRLSRFIVDDDAPAGISLELAPILFGVESHGWGNLAPAPGDLRELALAWHGDPGGASRPMFRTIDLNAWTPSSIVDLEPPSVAEAVLALTPGASTGSSGIGYGGLGYAAVWRRTQPGQTEPVAAVLDSNGQVMIGPHSVAPPSDYPGRSPDVTWTGSEYWLATSFGTAIQISRIRPASGDAFDDSGIEPLAELPATAGYVAGRAELVHDGTFVFVAWLEQPEPQTAGEPHVVLRALNPDGSVSPMSAVIGVAAPLSRVTVSSDAGISTLAWAVEGDPALDAATPGRSRIEVVVISSGTLSSATVESPLFDEYGAPHAIVRSPPGGLLVVWGARSMLDGHDVTYAARLDCQNAP